MAATDVRNHSIMAGKGSKPRPLGVERKVYEDNWNRIFGNKDENMWNHTCSVQGQIAIGIGEECSWCGAQEEKNKGESE